MLSFLLLLTLCWNGAESRLSPDLAGYSLCHGTSTGAYTTCESVLDLNTDNVCKSVTPPTTRTYWAVRAYDTSSNNSGWSNEVAVDPPTPTPTITPTPIPTCAPTPVCPLIYTPTATPTIRPTIKIDPRRDYVLGMSDSVKVFQALKAKQKEQNTGRTLRDIIKGTPMAIAIKKG